MRSWLVLAVLAATLGACDLQPVEETKIKEVRAPDGGPVAILDQRSCGATCSNIYVVYVGKIAKGSEVLIMDHGAPPDLHWQSRNQLVISAPCGRIFKFSNVAGYNSNIFIRLENVRLDCA